MPDDNGGGLDPDDGGGAGRTTREGGDAPRIAIASAREEYLLTPVAFSPFEEMRSNPILFSLAASSGAQFVALADQISGPDIEVVETIVPKGVLAIQSAGSPPLPPIIVAKMTEDKARSMQETGGSRLQVTPNLPLVMADATGFQAFRDPAVTHSAAQRFAFTIEVLAENGPLPNAEVFVYGSTTTAQAVTDRNGRASFALGSESQVTIKGLMVQPAAGYWNRLVRNPRLEPGSTNAVEVTPLTKTFTDLNTADLLGWGQKAMGLDRVAANVRGRNVRIAVVDSGADVAHKDLGHITRGFDFPRGDAEGWRQDTIGHGSHCAGIICGKADNRFGIRGFAPDAEVHVLRILPEGRMDDLVKAIQYCVENEIDVANLSLGGVGDPESVEAMRRVIEPYLARAKAMGTAFIVAAGNSSSPVLYPASSPNVLAVSAIGKLDEYPADSYHATLPLQPVQSNGYFFPRFSCFGPEVGVAGPGVAIVSSVPGDSFAAWDGTSMAAPHIAGLAALVLAHNPEFQTTYRSRNGARVDRLFDVIRNSAQRLSLGDPNRTGAGLPDTVAALQGRTDAARPPVRTAAPDALTPDQIAAISQQIAAAIQASLGAGMR